MPHKHKHKRNQNDETFYDLPPSMVAKPIPVTISKKESNKKVKSKPASDNVVAARKRKRGSDLDFVPREFKRIMAMKTGKLQSGLDDGISTKTKQKKQKGVAENGEDTKIKSSNTKKNMQENAGEKSETLKIRPGERMSDFSRRVDASLPLSGVSTKGAKSAKNLPGSKKFSTFKEKKMHKLYDQWRLEEAKIQDMRQEEMERAEEEKLERELNGVKWDLDAMTKKGKKGKWLGESKAREADPWLELKKKRGEAKIGLHDVVKAPPKFTHKPVKKLAVRGMASVDVDSVPRAAGSLRRREELQTVRQDVLQKYRELMSTKRPQLGLSK